MAVMVTNIWTPNSSGAVPQLTENLIISRDAMRKDGFTADVLALLPGGGGVQERWPWSWNLTIGPVMPRA